MQHNQKAENQILKDALKAFEEVTATHATIIDTDIDQPGLRADAEICLGDEKPILAEIKATVRPATLGNIIAQIKRIPREVILVTRYITPQLAETLKSKDIPFLDTAGNVYLRTPGRFYFVMGRKEVKKHTEKPVRAFRAKGLRVIFILLCRPDMLKAPYREIAEKAGVALGTVTNIVKDLEKLGYLYRSKAKGLMLENRDKLIDQWAEAYPIELKPELNPKRYRVDKPAWWKKKDRNWWLKNNVWLGGEAAAAVLTDYLYPENVSIYCEQGIKLIVKDTKPVKDEHGNLEVLQPFWNFKIDQPVEKYRVCPPLLTYAEMLATGDARQLDAAEIIREKYLVANQ